MTLKLRNTPPSIEQNESLTGYSRVFWHEGDEEGSELLAQQSADWRSFDPGGAQLDLARGADALHIGFVVDDALQGIVSYVASSPGRVAVSVSVRGELQPDAMSLREAADFHVIDECPDALAYHLFRNTDDVVVLPPVDEQAKVALLDAA